MKVPKTFIAEKNLDSKVKDLLSEKQNDNRDGLAIAVGIREHGTIKEGRIYVWEPTMKEPKLVRKRDALIFDLCYANNMLYDCGVYKAIYCTLYDRQVLIRTQFTPFSMLQHNNLLLFSELGDICSTNLEESYNQKIITSRPGWVYSLERHENKFYDAGNYGVMESDDRYASCYRIVEPNLKVGAICSHEGNLYSAGHCTIKQRIAPRLSADQEWHTIRNAFTKELIAQRGSETYALCSYKNKLLDGGENGMVRNSFTDEEVFHFDGMIVRALEPIPSAMVKALIETSQQNI